MSEQPTVGELVPDAGRDPVRAVLHGIRFLATRYWGVVILVLVWHGYVTLFDINVLVIPSPGLVFGELATNTGRYVDPTISTLTVAAVGVVGGTLMGVMLALTVVVRASAQRHLHPDGGDHPLRADRGHDPRPRPGVRLPAAAPSW